MDKLGFAIKLASWGASNAIECNKGIWTKKVVDIREYLKLFTGLQGTDNIVTFMAFDEEGCFLTLLRAISGKGGDFLSGWIYIPNTIEVSGEDVVNAYNYVCNILSQSNLNDYISDIESFFSKDYPRKEYVIPYVPSLGEEYGVRYIDMYYNMKEILDTNRYQSYYSKYRAIFLLDKNSEVNISKEYETKFKDLTKLPIEKTCILKAPSPEEVRLLGKDTKIVFQNGQEFKSPLLTKKGDRIQLYATRDGFEPVILPEVIIQDECQILTINHEKIHWNKRVKASMFAIFDDKHKKIEKGVRIFINGIDVTYQEYPLSEDDCRSAIVKVSASDYEPYEQRQNLLNNKYEITLRRKIKSIQTTIELANGHLAKMTIESKDLPSNHYSPLKGYDYERYYRGDEILKLSSLFVWKQRFWGFFSAIIVALLILVCAAFNAWLDTHHFKFGLPPWEKDRPAQSSQNESVNIDNIESSNSANIYTLNNAIIYLDSASVWSKSEMEKYPDLQGLYDDMNTFNLQQLTSDWYLKLSSSIKYKQVYQSANKTKTNNWNPKQGSHNPTYNKEGDEKINITNYINWLDNDQSSSSQTSDTRHNDGSNNNANSNASSSNQGANNESNEGL